MAKELKLGSAVEYTETNEKGIIVDYRGHGFYSVKMAFPNLRILSISQDDLRIQTNE